MRSIALLSALFVGAALDVAAQYTWKNVHTGASGGFVLNVVFNHKQKGLAFLRTDIGGAYKLNADGVTWTQLLDFADENRFDYWGVESIATDPVNTQNLYIEVGLYTNSWDRLNGTMLVSRDQGSTFKEVPLPFKVGGNMPGRGAGERLVIDPNNNKVLYLGARSGHGLYKSTDSGLTWNRVQSLNATGTFAPQATDTVYDGYNSDPIGVGWITFDTNSPKIAAGTSRIFVGVFVKGSPSIWVTNDAGVTWAPVPGQNTTYLTHHGVLSPAEQSLYVTYVDTAGPWDGSAGWIGKYNISSNTWTNITPAQAVADNSYGFGGISVDLSGKPGTVMVATLNEYYPDAQIWRTTDGGATWSGLYSASYTADGALDMTRYYGWDLSSAPWILSYTTDTKQIGWGIEGLSIDPFDSNHFLYGTGLTLYGSRNLLQWDTVHNITLANMANGIEETAVLGMISPPVGVHLISAVGDIGGWTHIDLDVAPATLHVPVFGTDLAIDYAGLEPYNIVRIGSGAGQLSTSFDGGHTWGLYPANSSALIGGKVVYSAGATTILWAIPTGTYISKNNGTFVTSTGIPAGAIIKADKANDSYFYGTSGGAIYVSSNGGASFAKTAVLGTATTANDIAVNTMGTAGEFWVSTAIGLWHSKDFGHTITKISSNLSQAWSISVGAPAKAHGTPALFAAALVSNVYGIYRSDNGGTSWTKINDVAHGFASISGEVMTSGAVVCGDPRIYKRVYVGTNGRGISYGN
ncbi:hypothetical protein FRB95_000935 [Tulasnella sp. JGI-2019a]|nr:hypothetical protein FRB95_000935 [Tulasnella sp. JGI-2019a]